MVWHRHSRPARCRPYPSPIASFISLSLSPLSPHRHRAASSLVQHALHNGCQARVHRRLRLLAARLSRLHALLKVLVQAAGCGRRRAGGSGGQGGGERWGHPCGLQIHASSRHMHAFYPPARLLSTLCRTKLSAPPHSVCLPQPFHTAIVLRPSLCPARGSLHPVPHHRPLPAARNRTPTPIHPPAPAPPTPAPATPVRPRSLGAPSRAACSHQLAW